MSYILIAYYSSSGHVEKMAQHIVRGIVSEGEEFQIRKIKPLRDEVGEELYLEPDDLNAAKAVVIGSPTRFGQSAAAVGHFWDQTTGLWLEKRLSGKLGAVFTSSENSACGQSTLFSLMLPMLHHGMMIMGMPTGSPYGMHATEDTQIDLAQEAYEFGKKIASTVKTIKN